MSSGLANAIAKAQPAAERIEYGPWQGSMRSRSADQVPRSHIADPTSTVVSKNYHYEPRKGYWKRRKGQSQKFDTFGSAVGLLPAKWSSKARQMDEFVSDSFTDGIPSLIALVTKETIASGTDDGRFSNVYVRDQVNSLNYTLGADFHTTNTYPSPGTVQKYKFPALWYDSGDGGMTRGVDEFQRRFFVSGSRSMQKVGNWTYFPSLYGTPSRWRGTFTPTAALVQTTFVGTDVAHGTFNWTTSTGAAFWSLIDDDTSSSASESDFILHTVSGSTDSVAIDFRTSGALPTDPGVDTGFVLKIRAKCSNNASTNRRIRFGMSNVVQGGSPFSGIAIGGNNHSAGNVSNWVRTSDGATVTNLSTSFDEYTYTLSGAECAAVKFSGAGETTWDFSIDYTGATTGGAIGGTFTVAAMEFQIGSTTTVEANRLFPSGPIPPTHCGYITKGTAVAGSATSTQGPDSDVSTGGWTQNDGVTTTNLYTFIDERGDTTDPVTDDYIRAYGSSTSTYRATLSDWRANMTTTAFAPNSGDTVKIKWRASRFNVGVGSASGDLTVDICKTDGTSLASSHQTLAAGFGNFEYTLTSTEIAAVTTASADWSDIQIRAVWSGAQAGEFCRLAWLEVEFTPGAAREGGWHGKDRFPFALAYRFEDDSIWAFTTPRLPSATLPSGLGIFTVDSGNPDVGYDKLTWTLPTPPYGAKKVLGLRGTKIDSTSDDDLAMNVHDMRISFEVDAGVTSHDDYNADDDSLYLDVDKLLIHEDHIMPPRARWNFAGDSRMCHSYGGLNPAAITLAPVGFTANYDIDGSDTSSPLYASGTRSYWQIVNTGTASSSYLRLVRDTGSVASNKDFAFNTYTTLQALMDAVNATSVADAWSNLSGGSTAGAQWRGQILPGVNPEASTLSLCPTVRSVTSVVTTSNTTLTKTAGGLSAIPVGAYVTGSGITDGTYVTAIVSDTQLTISANATASATVTLTFVAGTGDSVTGATHSTYEGYIRAIGNALPSFLYFTKTYLNQFPIEKSSVWMTTASPLSNKSAANNFAGRISNKHQPDHDVGISMGGAGVGNGFVTPFAKSRRSRIVNTRDTGSGRDEDYRLLTVRDSGCAGPVVRGSDCAFAFGPEGWYCLDLQGELLISGDIYGHARSDAVTGVGDFGYEAPLCVAAAGSDTDTAMMYARVMRNALWVSYRTSASTTHPDSCVCYDFSASNRAGVAAMLRDTPVINEGRTVIPPGVLWGWSAPLNCSSPSTGRSFTAMTEGRRSDGSHLYAWNMQNAGSTGDGRIDEFETGETDNGTAISAALYTPWESLGNSDNIAGREVVFEHSSPSGATVSGVFNRSFTGDSYTCTPDVSSTLIVSAYRWMLSLAARTVSAACYVGFTQTAGTAGELRAIELQATRTRDFRPGTAG